MLILLLRHLCVNELVYHLTPPFPLCFTFELFARVIREIAITLQVSRLAAKLTCCYNAYVLFSGAFV